MKTLVYFDIEATGLKSSGRPRISEISFVAINNQEILNLNHKLLEKLNDTKSPEQILDLETFLPRVLNKLALCVYPMATIMPEQWELVRFPLTVSRIRENRRRTWIRHFLC